jgi:hypothetical protein
MKPACARCGNTENVELFRDGLYLCVDREACTLRMLRKRLVGE